MTYPTLISYNYAVLIPSKDSHASTWHPQAQFAVFRVCQATDKQTVSQAICKAPFTHVLVIPKPECASVERKPPCRKAVRMS